MTKTRDLANLIADSKVGPSEIDTTGTYNMNALQVGGTTVIDSSRAVTADALNVSAASPNIDVTDTGTSHASQDFLTNSNAVRATIGVERSAGGGLFVGSSAYAAVFGTASAGNTEFATNNNVRMTLDTSGNLLVGKTSSSTSTVGAEFNSDGTIVGVRSGGHPLLLNRTTSDGAIAQFRKDNTTVGSIGTNGGRLSIGSGDVNLNFNASSNSMYPISDTSGTLSDGVIDVGAATARFKDFHLSGTIEIENGTGNVGVGNNALRVNTNSYNTAVGMNACYTNSSGQRNTALGYDTLYTNSSGQYNVAIGMQALLSNSTSNSNTAVGYQAGYTNTQAANTFVGSGAGYSVNSVSNTFIGANAGNAVSSGQKNTILGRFNGNENGLDIRTASNRIVLSDGDGNPRVHIDDGGRNYVTANSATYWSFAVNNTNNASGNGTYRSLLGANANNTSSYHLVANSSGDKLYIYGNGNIVNVNNSYGALSDQKLKENIVDSGSQWDDVKALTVRKYSMKTDELDAPNMLGVIAQEVEAAGMGGLVFESPDRDDDGNVLETSTKQVNYSILYMKAVKALQEAMDRIETLEAKVTALENA